MHKLKQFGPINSYVILPIIVVYFSLVILLPASKAVLQTYHLTSSTYHILLFFVELPLILTWLAAFYGYYKLHQYTQTIADTPEEPGFAKLTKGFQWLAWSLVIPTFWSLISSGIANAHPGFHPAAVIVGNYLSLLFPLIAYTWISNGADTLLRVSRRSQSGTLNFRPLVALFAVLSGTYVYLALRPLDLGSMHTNTNQYYLPDWLLLLTVFIPYLYAWFIGLTAVFEINTAARQTKGLLYRQGLSQIAGGVMLVIASSIASQCVRSITPHSGHLALNLVLVIVYLLYLVIVLGFGLMGLGAHKLKKIEDI